MNKRFLMAGALAALVFGGGVHSQNVQRVNTVNEVKATVERKKAKQDIVINSMGGLDFNPYMFHNVIDPNWVPKFGHPKRKTNKLRCKHNAKLKRR